MNFDAIVGQVVEARLIEPGDGRWPRVLSELLPTADDRAEFVRWATEHRAWSHNVADVADRVCAKPAEACVMILSDIAAEVSVRTSRDLVLAEAIRLIETTSSQAELFADVDARPDAPQGPRGN